MNKNSINFVRQHWRLLHHPSAGDFLPLIEQSVLSSLQLIVKQLEKNEWFTVSELAEYTGLSLDVVIQLTSAVDGQLVDKFQCPEEGRHRETAVSLKREFRPNDAQET